MGGWIAALLLILSAASAGGQLPQSSLGVETKAGWRTWWRSDESPLVWDAPSPVIVNAIQWQQIRRGVEYAELHLAGSGEAWRTRAIIVRLAQASVTPQLVVQTRDAGRLGAWSIDSATSSTIVALNAGQFSSGTPWGWLVRDGIENRAPGIGPLSTAVVAMRNGSLRLIAADSIQSMRANSGVVSAFQSYPTLLERGGVVPTPLRGPDRGIDIEHRDSRLAIGEMRDGRILIVLTRFEGLSGVLSQLPFGPTIPEMSALMGALGCTKAVALDGGISGQLMVRSASHTYAWRAYRRVPLGLVFVPR